MTPACDRPAQPLQTGQRCLRSRPQDRLKRILLIFYLPIAHMKDTKEDREEIADQQHHGNHLREDQATCHHLVLPKV